MAPSAATAVIQDGALPNPTKSLLLHKPNASPPTAGMKQSEFVLDRDLNKKFPVIVGAQGNELYTKDGRVIFDSTSGAAVSCLGHANKRVSDAIKTTLDAGLPYLCSTFFGHETVEQLCEEMVKGTDGKMTRVYLTGSGSEAMEATVKLSRQYFYEQDKETTRVNYIAREGSYHGNTIGALGVSGHTARRAPYLPFLMPNIHRVSACYPYRQRQANESDASFVARKAAELEQKFQELGPETVIGFIFEPVVGATLGCVPNVPGYLAAMRDVCHRHGALFILDEIMCGMGRTGHLHAWQGEGIAPDLQTVGKGLGGGYQPIAAVLVSEKVVRVLKNGTGQFIHGQTYQAMPVQAAAALEVQRTIRDDKILDNVQTQGALLEKLLKEQLGSHPHVGDIRGRGLFWGIEFVRDKQTKEPFDPKLKVAQGLHDLMISEPYNMVIYPCVGCADGVSGDHGILAPTYIVTTEETQKIANVTTAAVKAFFENF